MSQTIQKEIRKDNVKRVILHKLNSNQNQRGTEGLSIKNTNFKINPNYA